MLETIYLHVTSRCNLACSYCYLDGSYEERTGSQWLGVLVQLAKTPPRKLVLTGGEPLLYEGLFELAAHSKKLMPGTFLQLMTNGLLIHSENASHFSVFDELRISVDGAPEYADLLRGYGSTARAAEGHYYLQQAGVYAAASVTLMPDAPHSPQEIIGQVRRLGFSDIYTHALKAIGRGKDFSVANDPCYTLPNCGKGHYLNLMPDGSAYPCHALCTPAFYLGNVFVNGLPPIRRKLSDLFSTS